LTISGRLEEITGPMTESVPTTLVELFRNVDVKQTACVRLLEDHRMGREEAGVQEVGR
jgi:hypothetical protein